MVLYGLSSNFSIRILVVCLNWQHGQCRWHFCSLTKYSTINIYVYTTRMLASWELHQTLITGVCMRKDNGVIDTSSSFVRSYAPCWVHTFQDKKSSVVIFKHWIAPFVLVVFMRSVFDWTKQVLNNLRRLGASFQLNTCFVIVNQSVVSNSTSTIVRKRHSWRYSNLIIMVDSQPSLHQ